MNRVDRLLAQILFLQTRRVTTADEMARYFELSVRQIYRDIAALGEAGVPIVSEAGVGYTLMKGYHLPPVSFTAEEASALATGGMLVEQFADASLKKQMHSALLKVRAILPRDRQEQLVRLERGLAATAKTRPALQADLTLLQQALAERRLLRFHYQGANGKETLTRLAEPLGLIHYLDRWHLIAWCRTRAAYRDFRTDRMGEVVLLSETFAPRADFDLATFIRETMPAPQLRAKVRFDLASADRAKREWWMGIVDESREEAGLVLTLATVEWAHLVGWLLSFGASATVLTPASLRKLLVKASEAAATHHRKSPSGKVS